MWNLFAEAIYYGIILTIVVTWIGATVIVIWESNEWRKRK